MSDHHADEATSPESETGRRVASRSDLLAEEEAAGSDDPAAQAEAILDDSDERQADRTAAPDAVVEHRTSDEVTPPVD